MIFKKENKKAKKQLMKVQELHISECYPIRLLLIICMPVHKKKKKPLTVKSK